MWLIRTKLEAPSPTERLIARQRLRRRLSAVLRARLALVHAPAGFGKTCLLAEWQRCLNRHKAAGSMRPERFLQRLCGEQAFADRVQLSDGCRFDSGLYLAGQGAKAQME